MPQLTLSQCFQNVAGNASDIVRIFVALQTLKIINFDVLASLRKVSVGAVSGGGGTSSVSLGTLIVQAYRRHGMNWQALADDLRLA